MARPRPCMRFLPSWPRSYPCMQSQDQRGCRIELGEEVRKGSEIPTHRSDTLLPQHIQTETPPRLPQGREEIVPPSLVHTGLVHHSTSTSLSLLRRRSRGRYRRDTRTGRRWAVRHSGFVSKNLCTCAFLLPSTTSVLKRSRLRFA